MDRDTKIHAYQNHKIREVLEISDIIENTKNRVSRESPKAKAGKQ